MRFTTQLARAALVGATVLVAQAALAATKPTDQDKKDAAAQFASVCASCHGAQGAGDGAAAAALNPKPRNFGDAAWQKAAKDADIAKAIVEGGPAVGKSPLMPPNPQYKDKPGIVQAFVDMIRAFGKKKA